MLANTTVYSLSQWKLSYVFYEPSALPLPTKGVDMGIFRGPPHKKYYDTPHKTPVSRVKQMLANTRIYSFSHLELSYTLLPPPANPLPRRAWGVQIQGPPARSILLYISRPRSAV